MLLAGLCVGGLWLNTWHNTSSSTKPMLKKDDLQQSQLAEMFVFCCTLHSKSNWPVLPELVLWFFQWAPLIVKLTLVELWNCSTIPATALDAVACLMSMLALHLNIQLYCIERNPTKILAVVSSLAPAHHCSRNEELEGDCAVLWSAELERSFGCCAHLRQARWVCSPLR